MRSSRRASDASWHQFVMTQLWGIWGYNDASQHAKNTAQIIWNSLG